jgi:hypothetical protein
MRLKSKLAAAAATSAVAGAALLFPAAPASATNPPYADCPGWALCLYQHGGGTGSKAIITLPAAGSGAYGTKTVRLYDTHFLNGELANNQVSSWLNNSTCWIVFLDYPDSSYGGELDHALGAYWGETRDWAGQWQNDSLSGLWISC